jgi:hypothetical protein
MSFIQNHPLEGFLDELFGVHHQFGVGTDIDGDLIGRCRGPVRAPSPQQTNPETTGAEFIRPGGDDGRRTDNESAKGERRILEKTDGLEGLPQSHIVGQNPTPTDIGIGLFAFHHPTDAGFLVFKIRDSRAGSNEGHFVVFEWTSRRMITQRRRIHHWEPRR